MNKKLLLSIFTLLIMFAANFSFAQQNKSSDVSASGSNTFKKAALSSKSNLSAVPNTTTSTCMSINLPAPATWSLVNYGTGTPIFTDGFVNGPNIYGDKEKAMYFDASASANTMITQVYVGFDHAYSATPTKTVAVKFYDGTSGTPGASIGQGTLSMATIMTDVTNNQYSLIIFPTPLTLPASKKFFASVDVSALSFTIATKDSLSIVSNTDLQTIPTQTWEKWSTNAWYKYDNASSWQLDISLLIHPFLTQAPIVASITVPTGTLCTGTSITYSSTGSTAGTYDWYFGAATTSTATGATAATSYTSAGTYTTQMVVEDACGSFGIATKTINVNLSPTASLTSNSPVCLNNNINLNANGGTTYSWSGPNAFSSSSQNPTITGATTINSGVYTVTVTTSGCSGTASTNIVITTPTTTASNAGPYCVGSTIQLNAPASTTYTWTGPNAFASNLQNPTIFNATLPMSGNYTLIVTAGTCTASAVTLVTVNTATTSASNAGPYCVGATIQLNTPAALTYTWTGPGGFGTNIQNPSNPNATLAMGGTYTVLITAANTCTAWATTSVTVNPLPMPNFTSTVPCVGQPLNFIGTGGVTYTWSGPGGFTSNAQSPTIPSSTTSNSGTYTLSVTDSNNCTATTTGSAFVNPLPTVTASSASSVICGPPYQQTVTITAGGASTYTWNTTAISNSISVSPSVTTTYTVIGTDANGCNNTTTITQSVSACTGLQQLGVESWEFAVYPNPNNGEFTISVTGLEKMPLVEIYNTIGKLVFKDVLTSEKNTFNTNLAAGIYFINLIDNGKIISTKKLICK